MKTPTIEQIKVFGKQIAAGLDPHFYDDDNRAVFKLDQMTFRCNDTEVDREAMGVRLSKAKLLKGAPLPTRKYPAIKKPASFSWSIAKSFLVPEYNNPPEIDNFLNYMELTGARVVRAAVSKDYPGVAFIVDVNVITGTPFCTGRFFSEHARAISRLGIHHLPTGMALKPDLGNEKAALAWFKALTDADMKRVMEKVKTFDVINPDHA